MTNLRKDAFISDVCHRCLCVISDSSPFIEVEPGMTTGYVSKGSKPVVYSESSQNYERQTAISYKDTPLSTSLKSLPLKNLQFNDVPNLGISQLPVATASELNVLPYFCEIT